MPAMKTPPAHLSCTNCLHHLRRPVRNPRLRSFQIASVFANTSLRDPYHTRSTPVRPTIPISIPQLYPRNAYSTSTDSTATTTTPRIDKTEGVTLLPQRRLIAIYGRDTVKFLHGITSQTISADITAPFFTCFLNAQGRLLADAIIHPFSRYRAKAATAGESDSDSTGTGWEEEFLPKAGSGTASAGAGGGGWGAFIEVDGGVVDMLQTHMRRHKLRSKIVVHTIPVGEIDVWALWGSSPSTSSTSSSPPFLSRIKTALGESQQQQQTHHLFPDPRLQGFGHRLLLPSRLRSPFESSLSTQSVALSDSTAYLIHRYLHGIPEGAHEMPPASALPLECNMDYMHGIDFHKGCYVGQELTIRTKHRGVVRKRILPVQLYRGQKSEDTSSSSSSSSPHGSHDTPVHDPGFSDVSSCPSAANIAVEAAPTTTITTVDTATSSEPETTPKRRSPRSPRPAGKLLSYTGNIGLALCRLEMMTDLRVSGEGGSYKPGMEFGVSLPPSMTSTTSTTSTTTSGSSHSSGSSGSSSGNEDEGTGDEGKIHVLSEDSTIMGQIKVKPFVLPWFVRREGELKRKPVRKEVVDEEEEEE